MVDIHQIFHYSLARARVSLLYKITAESNVDAGIQSCNVQVGYKINMPVRPIHICDI